MYIIVFVCWGGEHKPGRIKPGRIKKAALSFQNQNYHVLCLLLGETSQHKYTYIVRDKNLYTTANECLQRLLKMMYTVF